MSFQLQRRLRRKWNYLLKVSWTPLVFWLTLPISILETSEKIIQIILEGTKSTLLFKTITSSICITDTNYFLNTLVRFDINPSSTHSIYYL